MNIIPSYNPFGGNRARILEPQGAENGEELLMRTKVTWKRQPTDQMHTVQQGETIEAIAQKYYANTRSNAQNYWWLITDANEIDGLYILNPLDIAYLVGKDIRIPDLSLLDFIAK